MVHQMINDSINLFVYQLIILYQLIDLQGL